MGSVFKKEKNTGWIGKDCVQEEEHPKSTERRSSSIVPAEPGCCPAMRRWFLWEKRLYFNLSKLSAVLCKKPNVILFLRMLACAVEAEEIRGRSDNILPLLRASKGLGCLGEPCLWGCKECGPHNRSTVCSGSCVPCTRVASLDSTTLLSPSASPHTT